MPKRGSLRQFFRSICTGFQVLNFGNNILQFQEKKGSTDVRVTLLEDQKTISEVVVIGYGVQKKSVVTASIAKVDASDLAETAPVRVDNALKVATCGDGRVAVMFF